MFEKIGINAKDVFGHINKIIYEVIDFLPPENGEDRCFDLVVKAEDGKTYKIDNMRYDEFVSYLVWKKGCIDFNKKFVLSLFLYTQSLFLSFF